MFQQILIHVKIDLNIVMNLKLVDHVLLIMNKKNVYGLVEYVKIKNVAMHLNLLTVLIGKMIIVVFLIQIHIVLD